jgi:hypothetical protein
MKFSRSPERKQVVDLLTDADVPDQQAQLA